MAKKSLIYIAMLSLSLTISACQEPSSSLHSPEAIERYSHISTFKGLEVYVWFDQATEQILVGMLPGTNRNKTEADYQTLYEQPIDLPTAQDVLSRYDADSTVFVMNLGQPLTQQQKEQVMTRLGEHLQYMWKANESSKSMRLN